MDRDLAEIGRRLRAGERLAVATVVRTWRSAPRPAGAVMAVTEAGEAIGSISGGCVEGAVYTAAREAMADDAPRLCRYGVSDGDAFSVGLTCGGTIEVLVEPVSLDRWWHLERVRDAGAVDRPVVVATVVEGGAVGAHLVVEPAAVHGSLGDPRLDVAVAHEARALLGGGPAAVAQVGAAAVFLQPFVAPPRLLVLGAIDFSRALCHVGRFLGYRVTVCDARATFATEVRFPDAHEVVVDWPHRFLARTPIDPSTVICVLTHDAKFDVPALEVALRSPATYVGAMGSRQTHADRLAKLREAGLSDVEIARLRSPIGLDLGASTPEETAVSIAAEILQVRTGAPGQALRDLAGPIHRSPAVGALV